jgi:hypothetical protein
VLYKKESMTEQKALHKQTIEARVKGKISDEDFTTMKDSIASEIKLFEQALAALDEEKNGMQELTKTTLNTGSKPCFVLAERNAER